MRRKELDTRLDRLLGDALEPEQRRRLRDKLRATRNNHDEFELYRQLELELGRMEADAGTDGQAETRMDALRGAMEREALLGRQRRSLVAQLARWSMTVGLGAAALLAAAAGLHWALTRAPLPGGKLTATWRAPNAAAATRPADPAAAGRPDPALRVRYARPANSPKGMNGRTSLIENPRVRWSIPPGREAAPKATATTAAVIVVLTPPGDPPDLPEAILQ